MSSRKPKWDWTAELTRAQNGAHSSIPMAELVAAAAQLKEESVDSDITTLPPLFKRAWEERMARTNVVGGVTSAPTMFPPRQVGSAAAPVTVQGTAPSLGGGDYYPGVQPGFVVGCTPDILDECFQRRLFGLPIQLQGVAVQYIQPGTPLFLQDVTTKMLHGLFEATSPANLNIERQAFTHGGKLNESMYPVQVRFQQILQAPMIPEIDPEVLIIALIAK